MSIYGIATCIRKLTYRELVEFATASKGSGYESDESYRRKLLDWADGVIDPLEPETPSTPNPPDHGIYLPLVAQLEGRPISDEQRIVGVVL